MFHQKIKRFLLARKHTSPDTSPIDDRKDVLRCECCEKNYKMCLFLEPIVQENLLQLTQFFYERDCVTLGARAADGTALKVSAGLKACERKCIIAWNSLALSTSSKVVKNSFSPQKNMFPNDVYNHFASRIFLLLADWNQLRKLHCDSIFLYKLMQRPRRLPFIVSNAMVDFATATLHECNQPTTRLTLFWCFSAS